MRTLDTGHISTAEDESIYQLSRDCVSLHHDASCSWALELLITHSTSQHSTAGDHRYLLLTPSVAIVSVSPVAPCRACQREVFVVFGDIPRCAHVISFATLHSQMRSVWKLTFENIFIYFTETNETGGLHLLGTEG